MQLTTGDGTTWSDPSAAVIDQALGRLLVDGDEFVVLARGDHHFMQCAHPGRGSRRGPMLGALQLEHRDGAEDRHFLTFSDDPVRVTETIRHYVAGADGWRQQYPWQRLDLRPVPVDQQPAPKVVTDRAVAEMADQEVFAGFRFVKTRRELLRRSGPWRHRITFTTVGHNARGVRAGIDASVGVIHDRVTELRTADDWPRIGFLAGSSLDHLLPPDVSGTGWNLVTERETAVWQLPYLLEHHVLGPLALFGDELAFVDQLPDRWIKWLRPQGVIQLLALLDAPDVVRRYLARTFSVQPGARAQVAARLAALDRPDPPPTRREYEVAADALAAAGLASLVDP